jgi:hypothetical protein
MRLIKIDLAKVIFILIKEKPHIKYGARYLQYIFHMLEITFHRIQCLFHFPAEH